MRSGEEDIAGDAMRSKTIEMTVEDFDIRALKSRIKYRFPEILRIDLVLTAAEKFDKVMNAVRWTVGKWLIGHTAHPPRTQNSRRLAQNAKCRLLL
jgi:hypothetical protein